MNQNEWVEKANNKHKNIYDYSFVKYVNSKSILRIVCAIHGQFKQNARYHLDSTGCKKCSYEKRVNDRRKSNDFYIEKARLKHNNKYNYSLVKFTNTIQKVKIICPEHGVFEQDFASHYTGGRGCPQCSKLSGIKNREFALNLTKEEFTNKANQVHNFKYDYSKTDYIALKYKITITCPMHGDFQQLGSNHLLGYECKECGKIKNKISTNRTISSRRKDFSHITPPIGAKVVPLTRGKYALVDEEDYERVMKFHWSAKVRKSVIYAERNNNGEHMSIHRLVMGLEKGDKLVIDHINHDGLDNRKVNLRICTHHQNSLNKRVTKEGTSQYKGVYWDKSKSRWIAGIRFKDVSYNLGAFKTEEEAARAYDVKAKELHKEFACLNFKD